MRPWAGGGGGGVLACGFDFRGDLLQVVVHFGGSGAGVGVFEGHGGGGVHPDGHDAGLAVFMFHDELRPAGQKEHDGQQHGPEGAEQAFLGRRGRLRQIGKVADGQEHDDAEGDERRMVEDETEARAGARRARF